MLAARPVPGDDAGLRAALLAAGLPVDDLTDPGRLFWRFDADGRSVGYGGLEPLGAHVLLRSAVVLPEARNQGHGRAMAGYLLALAAASGAERAFLLTTTAAAFFEAIGFVRLDRASAPPAILATRRASAVCGSAPLLTRALDGSPGPHAAA